MTDYTPTIENVRRAWAWWRKPMMVNKNYFPDKEALFEVTDLELDRWLQQVKAEAWDEGFAVGVNHDIGDWENAPSIINNPYRQETDR